jgi:hypothetical protein
MKRTTPRTLVQFFSQIKNIPDLIQERQLVELLAKGCLDGETADAFMNFVEQSLHQIPSPEAFLELEKIQQAAEVIERLTAAEKGIRLDLINTLLSRVVILLSSEYTVAETSSELLIHVLKASRIPVDLRYAFHKDLMKVRMLRTPAMEMLGKVITDREVLSQFVQMQ